MLLTSLEIEILYRRSVLNVDQTGVVIFNLLTFCLLLSMYERGIGPDCVSGQMSIFCLNWLQVFWAN